MRLTYFARPECWSEPKPASQKTPDDDRRWPNFFNHATARSICYPEHWGPLSIKCTFRGEEVYEANRMRYRVDPASYLILNEGRRYASSIDTREETESFVVFFRPGFAEEVLSSLISPTDHLLDEPGRRATQSTAFFETLHPHDDLVSPLLFRLREAGEQQIATAGWYEEQFHLLLERMLQAHRGVHLEMERIEAKRASTRQEVYLRLRHARDFIDAHFERKIGLTDAAAVAYLAPHHFLRLFKQAFRETPHQYLTRRRLDRARYLLLNSELPVTSICHEIGFESLGSFSTLFSRRFGAPPSSFRQQGS